MHKIASSSLRKPPIKKCQETKLLVPVNADPMALEFFFYLQNCSSYDGTSHKHTHTHTHTEITTLYIRRQTCKNSHAPFKSTSLYILFGRRGGGYRCHQVEVIGKSRAYAIKLWGYSGIV